MDNTYPIAPVTRVVTVRFTVEVLHCRRACCACPSAGGPLARRCLSLSTNIAGEP
jgi:hypothetical protein